MNAQPIFAADYAADRSRATTFFRLLLVIPHWIVVGFYGLGALVAVVIAWFALLVTGRWPAGLYGFVTGFIRYANRVMAYLYLLTDAYPPFNGGEHPEYPVRLQIGPPQAGYNRLKVLLRVLYVIPAYVIQYALSVLAGVIAFLSWFVIVFTGRQPKDLQDLIALALSYYGRSMPLFLLVTETYPSLTQEPGSQLQAQPEAPALQ